LPSLFKSFGTAKRFTFGILAFNGRYFGKVAIDFGGQGLGLFGDAKFEREKIEEYAYGCFSFL